MIINVADNELRVEEVAAVWKNPFIINLEQCHVDIVLRARAPPVARVTSTDLCRSDCPLSGLLMELANRIVEEYNAGHGDCDGDGHEIHRKYRVARPKYTMLLVEINETATLIPDNLFDYMDELSQYESTVNLEWQHSTVRTDPNGNLWLQPHFTLSSIETPSILEALTRVEPVEETAVLEETSLLTTYGQPITVRMILDDREPSATAPTCLVLEG